MPQNAYILEIPKCEKCGGLTPHAVCPKCRQTSGLSIVGAGDEADPDEPMGYGMSLVFTVVVIVLVTGAAVGLALLVRHFV